MFDVFAVVAVALFLIFFINELSNISSTLRECLHVLNEISNNTDQIKDNTDREYGYDE